MEIHVDTKKDSKEELKRVAHLLLSLTEGTEIRTNQPRNIFEDPEPSITPTPEPEQPATNAFAGMFGSDSTPSVETPQPSVYSLLSGEEEKPEEKEEVPKVIPY